MATDIWIRTAFSVVPPEPLYLEVLLQPLVEKLDLPPVLIQVRDLKRRQVERIRKKGEVTVLLVIMVSDQA